MTRLILTLWLLIAPGVMFANEQTLDAGFEAYYAGDFARALALSQQVLDSDAPTLTRLSARELTAFVEFDQGRAGQAFLTQLRELDRDLAQSYGEDALERVDMLSMISALEYGLGLDSSRLTDVQIVRIARQHPDAFETLLLALRNITVDYANSDDAASALRFAALYAFYAEDFIAPDDPIVMEAIALLTLELLRANAPERALEQFVRIHPDTWDAFAELGPDEAALIEDLNAGLEAVLADQSRDWQAELNAASAKSNMLLGLADDIGQAMEAEQTADALALMDQYLTHAPPEDVMAGTFLSLLMQDYLNKGQFARARPYLSGLLSYPANVAAVMDIPLATIAATAARAGGVEDTILEALLIKALEVENVLRRPNPELRVDLNFQLGLMRSRIGDHEAALAAFEQVLNVLEHSGHKDAETEKLALYRAGLELSALGRLDDARAVLKQLEGRARSTGDDIALSSALGSLALIERDAGQLAAAIRYSEQKLNLERARIPADPEGMQLAQINLAIMLFSEAEHMTPNLARLLGEIFDDSTHVPQVHAMRMALFRTLSSLSLDTPDELINDAVFAALDPQLQAELVAGLTELALDADDIPRAKSLLNLGFSTAAEGSAEYIKLRLSDGRIAQLENRRSDALRAFRDVTAQRLPRGVRPEGAALDHIPYHLRAAFDLASDPETGADLRFHNEVFQIAQFASSTVAGGALNDAVARSQLSGAGQGLLRERQVLNREISGLTAAISRARYDGSPLDDLLNALADKQARHDELGTLIAKAAPALASVSGFDPLRMEEVAKRLREDEALIVYVTSDLYAPDGAAMSFVVALSNSAIVIDTLPSREHLTELSRTLRCSAALTDPNCANVSQGATRGSFDMQPAAQPQGPVFDTALAHDAYATLFAPLDELISGKERLIIVADQALISLPFHLALKSPLAENRALRDGDWLIREHTIEVIPSVSSLVAMRDTAPATARKKRFLGVGDPLIGVQRDGPLAFECDTAAPVLSAALDTTVLNRGQGPARSKAIADLAALPDTRCELRETAQHFGADSTLLLHAEASEVDIKSLSETGALRDYSVISFATHGLVAGEIGVNDSGLVLSPPDLPTARNDGLLTTQEIAALDLDAEFVILSACNTASGDSRNREGLSGMASAFFFAGARSLMVSHWPVYSDAAVTLTTHSFEFLDANPGMTRADAVRQAMLSVLDDPNATARQTHPSYWAPFMIVGDGLGL